MPSWFTVPFRFSRRTPWVAAVLLGTAISCPVSSQEIERRAWTCENLQSQQAEAADYNGASMTIEYPVPRAVDFIGSEFVGANIVGYFQPPEPMNVTFRLPGGGGEFTGQPSETLYAQQSGEADIKAIGFFNAGIDIGAGMRLMATPQDADGTAADGSVEFRNTEGGLIPVTNAWDRINFVDWLESRCGASVNDAGSGVLLVMEGTVTEGSGTPAPGGVTRVVVRNLDELLEAREIVNAARDSETVEVIFEGAPNMVLGEVDLSLSDGAPVFFNVRPGVNLSLIGSFGLRPGAATGRISFLNIDYDAAVTWVSSPASRSRISGFGSREGAAVSSEGELLEIAGVDFVENFNDLGDTTTGGAINVSRGTLEIQNCGFYGNLATGSVLASGGAIWIGPGVKEAIIGSSIFQNNRARDGNDIFFFGQLEEPGEPLGESTNFRLRGSSFLKASGVAGPSIGTSGPYKGSLQFSSMGLAVRFSPQLKRPEDELEDGTIDDALIAVDASGTLAISGVALDASSEGVVFTFEETSALLANALEGDQRTETPCTTANADVVDSLGHNAASVPECELDQPTDWTDVNLMLGEPDERGVRTPLAGSPLVDAGRMEVFEDPVFEETLLPCGFVDLNGLGRPQDGNGDGVFECDIGATEFPGAGAIQAGHSAAYYNSARSGEGVYVEILDDSTAVVYTFSYAPGGNGAAWFVGLADIVGNSLVLRDVRQPVGARWGGAFDAGDVERTEWGGMSLVLPDCPRGGADGNMAFSGNPDLGFEPLITRAQKLSDIAGCGGDVTPHPNAGLSGSYYDASRSGEGLIVQWLPDGRVSVIMFTFGPGGKQLWITGQGQSDGTSVTIDALYPTGFTRWGSGFRRNQVQVVPWGTFTLEWTDCDTLSFRLDPTVGGFGGSQTRSYTRLTRLQGTSCPGF